MDGGWQSKQDYRYGFNGKEKDDEIKGSGNSLDFGARIYDSRLGIWMSVDPLAKKFPWQSPYCSMDNSPIAKIDPNGMSATPPDDVTLDSKGTVTKVVEKDGPNRFFDENGTELILNDKEELDSPMLYKSFEVGDKVYEPITRKESSAVLKEAGEFPYLPLYDLNSSLYGVYLVSYAIKSYYEYDFGHSYLRDRLEVTDKEMAELYYESGYVEGIPFVRFEGMNKLYNLPDAGNFLWGKKAMQNFLPKKLMLMGSSLNEDGSDTSADTKAIKDGYQYK